MYFSFLLPELDPMAVSYYGGMAEVWLNITLDATDVQTNGGPPTVLFELQVRLDLCMPSPSGVKEL